MPGASRFVLGGADMSASIFIARLLGPLFLVVGIALLAKPAAFRALLQEFIASPVLLYLAGFLGLLGGLALVLTHDLWVPDWRLIVTLIGWITIIRALVTVFLPQRIVAIAHGLLGTRHIFLGAALIDLALGLVLSYFGYAG